MPGLLTRLLPYGLAFLSSLCIMVLELVASRLVAQHIGASLIVWTSVIGVILAGICLGNVLGGRLADRIDPYRALGPLYAGGAALALGALWLNALIGYIPFPDAMPWTLRTVIVVTIDFLVPATVLGMIGPIVAKIAVSQSGRAGSAIGDVYFWGAVGSIVGTYLAGFWLINIAPVSTIVSLVAAGLVLIGGLLLNAPLDRVLGVGGAILLGLGSLESINGMLALPGLKVGNVKINALAAPGHLLTFLLAVRGLAALRHVVRFTPPQRELELGLTPGASRPRLGDLALLAFLASLAFMSLEMVAGRLVTRHMGSSIYGWTSVIGILLGGLSIGNFLGGKLADRAKTEKSASTLFLLASAMALYVLLTETPPSWLVRNPVGYFFGGETPRPIAGSSGEFLYQAGLMVGYPWWFRVFWWTAVVFLVPAISMGTVSPLVAKLAIDRMRSSQTGSAIGSVYAWGMVGSLVGTFLTGFLLIDVLGTKGVLLALAAVLAIASTALGSILHAAWAGVPLGLCAIAFLPPFIPASAPEPDENGRSAPSRLWATKSFLMNQATTWGLREKAYDPDTVDGKIAYVDESNYYYIKVTNDKRESGLMRQLVLDNLIHGYVLMGQPEVLDYDYEHIYALVTDRFMREKAHQSDGKWPQEAELGSLFVGGGSYTFPRYLQATYPRTWAEIAEIDPAVTRANHIALGLPWPDSPLLPAPQGGKPGQAPESNPGRSEGLAERVEQLSRTAPAYRKDPTTGQAAVVLDGQAVLLGEYGSDESRRAYIEKVESWHSQSKYRIRTTWGDARQYVAQHQDKKFDIIYGDAFNDFSVPWHLTTHEFNTMVNNILTPNGVYMINIIDAYESDQHAASWAAARRLGAILKAGMAGKWESARSRERTAREIVSYLSDPRVEPYLANAWHQLGARAAGSLDPGVAYAPAEIERRMRAALGQGQVLDSIMTLGAVGVRDTSVTSEIEPEMAGSIRAMFKRIRAEEVLELLDDARQEVRLRVEREVLTQRAADAVLETMGSMRTAALPLATAPERMQTISGEIELALETVGALADTLPGELGSSAEEVLTRLLKDYDAKKAPSLSVQASIRLIEAVKQMDERLNAEYPGDDRRAEIGAIRFAGQLRAELRRVERDLSPGFVALTRNQRGDDALAESLAPGAAGFLKDRDGWVSEAARAVPKARESGGFLGAWVNTARKTFPHVYVFGTASSNGLGDRETFVVVASRAPIDVADLGRRSEDPSFFVGMRPTRPVPYTEDELAELALRSRGVVLTDDYAPVENLLARVADTRAID